MIQALLLAAWALSGVAIAALLAPRPGDRFGWGPMAIIFGPLWAAIVVEQRSARRPAPARRPVSIPDQGTLPAASLRLRAGMIR